MRQQKKNVKTNLYEEDIALLMTNMDQVIEGNFSAIDISAFHNQALAAKYNAMLTAILNINNGFVLQMNKAMRRIADGKVVREMLELVNSQAESISNMRGSSQNLDASIQNIQSAAHSIQDNSRSLTDTSKACSNDMNNSIHIVNDSSVQIKEINKQVIAFKEKTEKINEIIDNVRSLADESSLLALNASIEAARAGDAGRGFGVVAQQMSQLSSNTTECADDVAQYVAELTDSISVISDSIDTTTKDLQEGNDSVHKSIQSLQVMNGQLNTIRKEIDSIYEEINTQSSLTQTFIDGIETISDSYSTLSQSCMDTGVHMYHISRDVDNARNDMAKHNSRLTDLDWLTVFEIDHLTLTWRLYNNIMGFEHLLIKQLNNPQGCKFGKWTSKLTDSRVTGSDAFKQAVACHEELHRHACDSWNYNEEGDKDAAMNSFDLALGAFERFSQSLAALQDVIKSTENSN